MLKGRVFPRESSLGVSCVSRGSWCAECCFFPMTLSLEPEKLGHIQAVRNWTSCLKLLISGGLLPCGAPWGGWSFSKGCWCQGWGSDPPVQSLSLSLEVLRWFHEREIQSSKGAMPQIQAVLGVFGVKLMELFVLSVSRFRFQTWSECSSPCLGVPSGSVLSQELKGLLNDCQCKQSLPDLEPTEICALLIFDCACKGQVLRKFCLWPWSLVWQQQESPGGKCRELQVG